MEVEGNPKRRTRKAVRVGRVWGVAEGVKEEYWQLTDGTQRTKKPSNGNEPVRDKIASLQQPSLKRRLEIQRAGRGHLVSYLG